MSFFVSKDIEARLDEETLETQSKPNRKSIQSYDYCLLCVDNNEALCYYNIKKFNFLNKNRLEVVIDADVKLLASIFSSDYKIIKISMADLDVKVVEHAVKSGEINRNGAYDLVISCLTE